MVRDFTNDFWKILKVLLKKLLICEIYFFFKILRFTIFFIILLFLRFYFQYCLYVVVKNSRNLYVFLFYGLEILSKNFGKSWNIFLKDIDI